MYLRISAKTDTLSCNSIADWIMIKNDQLFQFISARKTLQHSYRMASTIVVQTEIYKKNVIIRELEISKANGSYVKPTSA